MTSGIYAIYNTVNGKFYIGSAVRFSKRFQGHSSKFNSNAHPSVRLQNAYNKYGKDAFQFLEIEHCEPKKLLEREQWWIDLTQCYTRNIGYNSRKIVNSNFGLILSDETKRKIGLGNKGRIKTKEEREKLSKWHKGKILSVETRKKLSDNFKGSKHSEATKAKMSLARTGLKRSEETKAKISLAQRGLKKEKLRKLEKWSCLEGAKCNCRRCKNKRNQYLKKWRKDAELEK